MRPLFCQALWAALSATAIIASAMLTTSAQAATIVYVGSVESNEIFVFQLNRKNGELTLIEKVSIPGVVKVGGSTPITVSPDRRLLYVATRSEPQMVSTFSIEAKTGKLKHIGNGPLVDSMPYISTDRTGRYMFAASYPGHKLTVSPINAQGIIQSTQQILSDHKNAHSILIDKQNRYVLAPSLGNDKINQFKFDATTGKLEPNTPASVHIKEKSGPRHLIFHPNGKVVYVIAELDGAVYVFDYDASKGLLKEKQSVSGLPPGFTGKPAAADIHITPNGKFVYSTERTSSTIMAYKVNASDGTLTPIESIPTEANPRSFSIDSSGQYLFVVGMKSNNMSSYKIDGKSGKLIKLKEYTMGKIPNWVEIVNLP